MAAAFCLIVVAAGCGGSRVESARAETSTIVLSGVTIIDGTGSAPIPDQAIVIVDASISQVGDSSSIVIPPDAKIIELAGKWVVPGFIDLHVHLPSQKEFHAPILDRLLEFGVTTFLNPGARRGAGPELRERIATGQVRGPRMFSAGPLIDVTPAERGYGAWAIQTPSVAKIRSEVRRQAASGVDFIKLYAGLSDELVAAGIDEGHNAGVRVIGHLESANWTDAANSKIDMLVHSGWSTPMDEIVNLPGPKNATIMEWYSAYADAPNGAAFRDLVQALIRNKVVVVPTLAITQAGSLGSDSKLLPYFQTELAPERNLPGWWGEGWELRHPQYEDTGEEENHLIETMLFPAVLGIHKAFYDGGVMLAVGTDVGNAWMTPGASFHHELFLYQEAGIPPIDILTMATRNGALALGLEGTTGSIESGKQADLVVLGANPVLDIRNTRRIEHVFLAGQEFPLP